MKVIAIYPGHNATVGLFDNGRCQLIFHEEKLNNVKNWLGFPVLGLKELSKIINFDNVDYFVFGTTTQMMLCTPTEATHLMETSSRGIVRRIYDYLEYKTGAKFFFTGFRNLILKSLVSPKAWREIETWLFDHYKIERKKIVKIDHHLAHALTPVYFYGLQDKKEKTLILTMDASGDFFFSKVHIYDPNQKFLQEIAATAFDCSLGLLYSEVTKFLGMKPYEHEYKVMGLAAYVSNSKYYDHIYEKLSSLVWLNEDKLTFGSKFNMNVASIFLREYCVGERFDNVAAALQKFIEKLVLKWIKAAIGKTGIKNVAVSGGIFMNVKMNAKILELEELEKIYIQPSCGDESLVIGSAAKVFMDNGVAFEPIKTIYLGHKYNSKQVEEFLNKKKYLDKYDFEYKQDIDKEIARLLAEFKIVARFKGSCEWGARSLCNRGILANGSDLESFYEVNDIIKMRDFWMPFAPTILEDWADRYIENWRDIKEKAFESFKYMIVTCDSTELAKKHLKAAIHQKDKTLRPQILEKRDNIEVYNLLKYYENITGMGGFLNTSFNLHGYPLVGTLEQAIFTFENSGLKYLTLENFLVTKKGGKRRQKDNIK